VTVYLDSSSFVKLYVEEPGSPEVRRIAASASLLVTSGVAYPEIRAALARRRRERSLRAADFRRALTAFERDWGRVVAITVSDDLCQEAGGLAERYALRGFDAIHLASFAELLRGLQGGEDDVEFSSFDDRLNRAARRLTRSVG
jgi:predicted nucleic acid-binding protein